MPETPRRNPLVRAMVWLVTGLVVAGILAAAVVYTEQPSFCRVCHEMQPFYNAWSGGTHADTSCIDCHVDPGLTARFMHKFVALKEVWDHFTTKPTFPSLSVDVPDSRCTPCHDVVNVEITKGFTHAEHAKDLACQQCHASTGHRVTFKALDAAGILRPGTQPDGAVYVGESLPATGTTSVLKGHTAVPCSTCHDMARAQCSMCHQAPANHFGVDCKTCHNPSMPFDEATFNHPRVGEHSYRSFPCGDCHPDGYKTYSCTQCHKDGVPQED